MCRGLVAKLFGLHELPSAGDTLAFAGRQEYAGATCRAADAANRDGFSRRPYLDPPSFLVAREAETSALHPDMDSRELAQETAYFGHGASGGIVFARRSEKRELSNDRLLQSKLVTSIEPDAEVDAAVFRRPALR